MKIPTMQPCLVLTFDPITDMILCGLGGGVGV